MSDQHRPETDNERFVGGRFVESKPWAGACRGRASELDILTLQALHLTAPGAGSPGTTRSGEG